MNLTPQDIEAISALFDEKLDRFESKMDKRFQKVLDHIDGLYKHDETREQEFHSLKNQFDELEKKIA